MDGTNLVVGAPEGGAGGVVYVYDLAGGTPTVPILTLNNPGGGTSDDFGCAVAIDGNKIVVGARGSSALAVGHAYVYDLAGTTPAVPILTLNSPGTNPEDWYGGAVGISGTKVAVGAYWMRTLSGSGHVYVYDLAGSTPSVPVHTVTSLDNDEFGRVIVLAGNRLVVGAPVGNRAYVYDLGGSTPTVPVVTAHDATYLNGFGAGLALSGNLLTVAGGVTSVYDLDSPAPATAVLTLGTYPAGAVALSGTMLALGYPSGRGVAYVFGPQGPVAIPGGPYHVDLGQPLTLDGSGSYHPVAGRSIVSYAWDLDDDGQFDDATGTNPTLSALQFANLGLSIGTHTIHLRVTDNFGATSVASTTLTQDDGVNAARITATPNPAACNQTITFDGSTSVDPTGHNIVSYAWDFGDGATAAGMIVTHEYAHFGNYTAKLTITNDNVPALSDSEQHTITVNVGNNAPSAVVGGPYNINEGQLFALDGSASSDPDGTCGDSIVEYTWDLDNDGQYDDAFGATVVMSLSAQSAAGIAAPGVHTVHLRVIDSLGLTDTASSTVTVAAEPLITQVQHAVAVGPDVVAVGAPNEQGSGAPSAYGTACVLRWDGTNWNKEADIVPSNPALVQKFGHAVAIIDDIMVVGAPGESSAASGINGAGATTAGAIEAGAVYVFKRNAGAWTQQALIKQAQPGAGDHFGAAIALFGDTLVVGAPDEDSAATDVGGDESDNAATNSGAVYVFTRSGSTWAQEAYLKASNTGTGDRFGTSVSLSGDVLAVGAGFEDSAETGVSGIGSSNSAPDSGAVYVFRREGEWLQEAYLKPSNTGAADEFGRSVAVSGARVIVGAPNEDSDSTTVNSGSMDNTSTDRGAAYVFVFNGAAWVQEAYVKQPNGATGDHFGASVAMSRGRVVIGAEAHHGTLADSGLGYAFEDSGSGWAILQTYVATTERVNDLFAGSVAILDDVAVFGAVGAIGAPPNTPLISGGATIFRDATWGANAPPLPNMRTQVTEGSDLTPTNVSIVSEAAIDAGHYLFELSHDLLNAGTAVWKDTSSAVKSTVNDIAFHVLRTMANVANSIGPGDVVVGAAEQTLHVVVNAVDEAEFVALATSGQLMQVVAKVGDAVVVNPAEAVIQGGRVLAVTTLTNGQKLIEFTADVRNAGTLLLKAVELQINQTATATPFSSLAGGMTYAGTLHSGDSATGTGTCYAMCDQVNAATARAALLDGSAIEPRGEDVMIFGNPNYKFDATTTGNFSSLLSSATETEATLVFTASSSILRRMECGDIISEDTSGNDYYFRPAPILLNQGTLSDFLPIRVKRIKADSGAYTVVGERVNLINVVKSGTFTGTAATGYHSPVRDPFDPPLGNTFTNSEKASRESQAQIIETEDPFDGRLAELRGFNATPISFNDFHPIPAIPELRLNGEVNVAAVPFSFQMQTRDFGPTRIIMRSEMSVETHLVLECDTGIGVQFNDETKLFPDILLPEIMLGNFATIQPHIYGKTGLAVTIPDKITVPFEASARKGMIATWNVGTPMTTEFYEEHEPLHLSDPEVFKEFGADISAFIEVGAEFEVHPSFPDIASFAVSIAARPTLDAHIRPFANPWWTMDGQLRVMGGLGVALDFDVLEVPIYERQDSLHDYPLFAFDAGGPLIPPLPFAPSSTADSGFAPASSASSSTSSLRPLGAARNKRWGRILAPTTGPLLNTEESWIISLTDGTMVCGWPAGPFARLTADGELLWMRTVSTSGKPIGGVALEDNSFILFQQPGNSCTISHWDANGNRLWTKTFAIGFGPNCAVGRQVPDGLGGTTWEFFVAGFTSVSGNYDAGIVKFDAAGNLVWAKRYPLSSNTDSIHGLCILSDNNLAAVGQTEHTVGTQSQPKGLVMKINAASGDIMWATALIGPYPFKSVTEGPDGTIYALGDVLVIVNRPYPPISVARFTPEGANTALVQIGPDPDYSDPVLANTKIMPAGDIRWANGGLYACGHILTTPRQSWVMRLDKRLGVTSFVSYYSDTRDVFLGGLGIMPDGVAVAGNSNAGYPWPGGGTAMPVLLKLPWEGLMRFHPDCPLQAQFQRPRVYRASDHGDFVSYGQTWAQFSVAPVDLTTSIGTTANLPPLATSPICVPLERKDPNAINGFDDWVAYYQIPAPNNTPTTDSDGDGISNGLEAYFGLNPFAASALPPLTVQMESIGQDVLPVLEFDRARYADTLGFGIETSTDLLNWLGTSSLTTLVAPVSTDMEQVWIYNPISEGRRFYRASSTPPPAP
ncbi:MAG: PKD domain-containing protein [Verrucomicrobiales bacterium]|nr:PKD domain-containing protein [Verrucomicrobiales bacterium]